MALADAFSAILADVKEAIDDPAVKQAVSDELARVESVAAVDFNVGEEYVAAWFAKHYALPAPTSTTPAPVEAPVTEPVAADAFAPAPVQDVAQVGQADVTGL